MNQASELERKDELASTNEWYPHLAQIRGGWSAHGAGWAVHGSTPEEATDRYHKMEAMLAAMARRPYWRDCLHQGQETEPMES